MISDLKRLENQTIELNIVIPWSQIEKEYQAVVTKKIQETEIPGFRKGKVPKKLAEEKLDKSKVYEEVIRNLLPRVYNEVITKHNLRPVINPKIELKEASEGKDWKLVIFTAEKPEISLGTYRQALSDLNKTKRAKIWTPKEGTKPEADKNNQQVTLDELLDVLYKSVEAKISTLLIEHEVNRMLSDLLDQTKKLGLTVEQYLSSTARTPESLRHEYEEQARRLLTLEFVLEEIADKEGIFVSDDEIDKAIESAKSEQEKNTLKNQKYYLASVLRRQKTIDYLSKL